MSSLPPLPLPDPIRQRIIELIAEPTCALKIHILEAGAPTDPLILLLHGYPELAFTWRHLLLPLASHGFHVVAPDSRGYGRTTGWGDNRDFESVDLGSFTQTQLVLDNIALMRALGHEYAKCVVGHDFGVTAASGCVLARPDLFRRGVFVSHVPSAGKPLPAAPDNGSIQQTEQEKDFARRFPRDQDVHRSLAEMGLKHYQWYNSTPSAAHDWANPQQGMSDFLLGYFYLKSHAWQPNLAAGRLTGWTAAQLARMPRYYIMHAPDTMPSAVQEALTAAGDDLGETRKLIGEEALDVYVAEFTRTGFQGMLNWYRSSTSGNVDRGMALFAGRKYEVPVVYIGGVGDWGNYQRPGALEGLEEGLTVKEGCYRGTRILGASGHWPQIEEPGRLCEEILKFISGQ